MDLIEYYVNYLVDYFVVDFVEIDYAFEINSNHNKWPILSFKFCSG
jgi:hypothetical protein